MPTPDDKGAMQSGKIFDFRSYRARKGSLSGAEVPEIASGSYIPLIHLAQRAEVIWGGEKVDVRRHELELLDIRDRTGRPIPPETEHISLLDLDRDFVTFRIAGLAAREDLQRRGIAELDADAAGIWDNIEETISCIKDWDAFVEAVRAHGRSVSKPGRSS